MANPLEYTGGDTDTLNTSPNLPSRTPKLPQLTPQPMADQGGQGDDIIAQLLASIKGNQSPQTTGLADLSSVLGGFSSGEKSNRMVKGNFTQNYDALMQQAQNNRNDNENDALHKLAVTSYLKGGGFQGKPTSIQLNGQSRSLPSFGSAPRPASEAQMQGAGTLEQMLTQRLASGGSAMPTPLSEYADPGMLEKMGGYGGATSGGLGVINSILDDKSGGNGNVIGGIVDGVKRVPWGKVGSGIGKLFGM